MADFKLAIPSTLRNEGKFSDDPRDPGGITAYGWSLRGLIERGIDVNGDGRIDRDDVLAIYHAGPQAAVALYDREIWEKHNYGLVRDQAVANKIFDMAVNMGEGTANMIAQKAAVSLGATIAVDGVFGPKTVAAINALEPPRFMVAYKRLLVARYQEIVRRHPELAVFLPGWLTRADA